jgi:hypothetical protein
LASILVGGLLAFVSCSQHGPEPSGRLQKYAKEKGILYTTDFPIYFQVEVVERAETQAALQKLLEREGFRKTDGAAYGLDGKRVSQTFYFSDTFEMGLSSVGGRAGLLGYGITNSDHRAEPVLRRLLREINSKYKVERQETKGL